jgi:TRAP transporter TAXI family solute receptor
MRRTPLLFLAAVLALVAASAVTIFLANLPTTLTIAVGPGNVENHRIATLLAQLLQRERAEIRLRVVTTDGAAASAALLQAGQVQLAIVRSDVDYPADGLLVANLRRDVLVIMTPPDSVITSVADLRGKSIGVVFAQAANQPLFRRIASHYELRDNETRIEAVTLEEAGVALKDGRVDAIFTVGNASGRQLADLVAKITEAIGAAPNFVPILQAEAIARRTNVVEASDIVRGAFGGSPPRPTESVQTLGIAHRIVAHRTLPESSVASFTQVIFALRPALAAEYSLAAQIEAPETDRGSAVPVHPGAIAYVEGNIKTFLDRYGDWFYIIVMVVGIVGSGIAGLASLAHNQGHARKMGDLNDLMGLLAEARAATDKSGLDAVEARVDTLLAATLERISARELDSNQIAAFTLGFDQVRRAIADRRLAVPAPSLRALSAAE